MVAWDSSGDVLRWWRSDVLGLTQQEAAERLNVRPSAVSNWERGDRAISIDLGELDEALKGEQALAGLLWSHSTPEGVEAGHRWTKVFPGASRPVWMWLRSTSSKIAVIGEWGVARLEAELDLGPNGLFITVGASLPDSPVVVLLSNAGWADFGCGELPPEIPGAPTIPAISMFERSSANGAFMKLFSSNLAAQLSAGSTDAMDLAGLAPGGVVSYLQVHEEQATDGAGVPGSLPEAEGLDAIERARFARLRGARGLSLSALAGLVRKSTGLEVSRDTLRRFESDVGRPHDPELPVALDYTLGAGGRLAVLETKAGSGEGGGYFPSYWRGPFWLELEDSRGAGQVVLRRGRWQRELSFDGPTLVSAHWFDPAVPFRIIAEPTTRWSVGVGRRAGAEPIDQNWNPVSVEVARQALVDTQRAIFTAADRAAAPDQQLDTDGS